MNDTTYTFPTPADLRTQIATAQDRAKQPIRDEANKVLAAFHKHILELTTNPDKFTSKTHFGYEHPNYGGGRINEDYFYTLLRTALPGYKVERSHDGGGMYEVVSISWQDEKTYRPMCRR